MARVAGIEPATRGFGDRRSTIELHRHGLSAALSCRLTYHRNGLRPVLWLTAGCFPRSGGASSPIPSRRAVISARMHRQKAVCAAPKGFEPLVFGGVCPRYTLLVRMP